MNLQAICRQIESELRYAPQSLAWTLDLKGSVNYEMQALAGEQEWPFLTNFYQYNIYPDFQIDALLTNGSRTVVPTTTPTDLWVGCFLVDTDNNEYEIAGHDGTNLYLVDPWVGTTGTQTAIWIRYRQYRMPRDCMAVYDQVAVLQGSNNIIPMSFVSQTENAAYPIFRNIGGGQPGSWLLKPTQTVQPPMGAPVATLVATAGTLATVATRYAYTIVIAGRESAPSLITTAVTPTGLLPSITLSGLDAPGGSLGLTEGMSRRIYRETATYPGLFLLRTTQTPSLSGVSTYTDTGGIVPASRPRMLLEPTQRYLEIRPYPGNDYEVTMRYKRRLSTLDNDNDEPPWDSAYHDVLVWRVALRIMSRPGQEPKVVQYFKERYEERYKAMKIGLLGDRIRKPLRLWQAQTGDTARMPLGPVPRFIG